jgi:diguanylate cyclase (GGDEF)-like protein
MFTALEFWRLPEQLPSRYPAAVLIGLNGVFYLVRIPLALTMTLPARIVTIHSPWIIALTIEAFTTLIAVSLLVIAMAKERSESVQRTAASTDALTGAASRRFFVEEAERRLLRCSRQASPAAVLMIDLDHFKEINDRHGHETGDRVLRAVAEGAMELIRPDDLFGRLGGEEFALFLSRCSRIRALVIAERVRAAVSSLHIEVKVSVSIGIASTEAAGYTLPALLREADRALYAAKKNGRNCVMAQRLAA